MFAHAAGRRLVAECELLRQCIFYNDRMKSLGHPTEELKKRFCLGEYRGCARHIVYKALGREKVPLDMYPEQLARAEALINLHGLV